MAAAAQAATLGALALALSSGTLEGSAGFWLHALLHAAAFAPLVWVVREVLAGRTFGRSALIAALAAGVVARAFFLAGPPVLSGDLYRSVWEGQVVAAGLDPWAHPPDHPELEDLRRRLPEVREEVAYWMLPAIYPPGAQLFAAAVTSLAPSPRAMAATLKLGFALAEAALVWALIALLRRRGLDPLLVVAYVWNPLAVVEISGSGHGDALGVALLAVALAAAAKRPFAAAALAGLSATAKFAGFALVPFLAAGVRGWKARLGILAAGAGAALFPLLPFLAPAPGGDGVPARLGELSFSLVHYLRHWRFNESLFLGFEWALGDLARPAALLALLAVGTALLLRPAPLTLRMALLAGSAFLLAPVAHPWYLLWCLPFLVLHPERRGWFVAGLALSLTSVLSYQPFWTTPPGATAEWVLSPGLRAAEYLIPLAAGWLAARSAAVRRDVP